MKNMIIILIFIFKAYSAEIDLHTKLNYIEKLQYIDPKQFNHHIQALSNQGETNKKIAECLLYIKNEMHEILFYLNGINSQLKSVAIDTDKNAKIIKEIEEKLVK